MATHESEVTFSSTSKVCQNPELNNYERNFNLTNNSESTSESNIFSNQVLTIENEIRPMTLLEETHVIISLIDDMNQKLRSKVLELEIRVKEIEFMTLDLHQCRNHIDDNETLNLK